MILLNKGIFYMDFSFPLKIVSESWARFLNKNIHLVWLGDKGLGLGFE